MGEGVAETSSRSRFYTESRNIVAREPQESVKYLANTADALGNNDGIQPQSHHANACNRGHVVQGGNRNQS